MLQWSRDKEGNTLEVTQAMQTVEQEFMSVKEAAGLLGVHKQAVYIAIRENRLPSVRILGNLVVRREDVRAYQQRTAEVGPQGGRPRKLRRPVGRPRKAS